MRQYLTADIIVTMAPGNPVVEDGALLIDNGRITAIGPRADLARAAEGVAHRDLRNHVIMPGLINTHCHSGLLRGTAEGLPVWDWLETYINPMHRVLSTSDAEAAS